MSRGWTQLRARNSSLLTGWIQLLAHNERAKRRIHINDNRSIQPALNLLISIPIPPQTLVVPRWERQVLRLEARKLGAVLELVLINLTPRLGIPLSLVKLSGRVWIHSKILVVLRRRDWFRVRVACRQQLMTMLVLIEMARIRQKVLFRIKTLIPPTPNKS